MAERFRSGTHTPPISGTVIRKCCLLPEAREIRPWCHGDGLLPAQIRKLPVRCFISTLAAVFLGCVGELGQADEPSTEEPPGTPADLAAQGVPDSSSGAEHGGSDRSGQTGWRQAGRRIRRRAAAVSQRADRRWPRRRRWLPLPKRRRTGQWTAVDRGRGRHVCGERHLGRPRRPSRLLGEGHVANDHGRRDGQGQLSAHARRRVAGAERSA